MSTGRRDIGERIMGRAGTEGEASMAIQDTAEARALRVELSPAGGPRKHGCGPETARRMEWAVYALGNLCTSHLSARLLNKLAA